jgi:ankyrin repeat protein
MGRRWILAQALHAAGASFRCNDDLSDVLETLSQNGFYEFVRILIKAGATPKDENFFPYISDALPARKRHSRDWDLVDISGSEAFPRRNHALTLKELLALRVNINQKSSALQLTAIQIAAERGIEDTSYLAALLKGGADPYAETNDGFDSFDLALLRGKLDNLAILVQHAAHDPSRDHWLTSWLRESGTIPQGDQESFAACIAAIRHSRLYAAHGNNGHTLLFHAVKEENRALAEELIGMGSDVNTRDPLGWTPFHEAVRTHRTDMVELLISEGANVLARVQNTSPYSSFPSTLPHTDEEGPVINALHIAVGIHPHSMHVEPDIVRLLLENGIDPNAKAINVRGLQKCSVDDDATPLQIMFRKRGAAKSREFFAAVQLLVDFGADVRGISDGMDVREVASFEGFEGLWEVFRNADPVS